jgi:alpha-L-fucosidase
MKTLFLGLLLCVALCGSAHSQYIADSTLLLPQADMEWWRDAKFGLFIHYGLYAIPGRGEWVMWQERIDTADYGQLRAQFSCDKLDAREWVAIAQEAGCKYMVLTARHHDGFCLFDTKFGSYDARHSAAGRDIVREYVDAAHKAGMRTGIYYSPLDWRYPGFFFPDLYRSNAEEMKKQTYTQVRELLTNYGKVDILWYDGGEDNWLGFGGLMWNGNWYTRGFNKPYTGKFSWEPVKLNRMVRELQPGVVISQRSGWIGDFDTQEMSFGGRPKSDASRPYEFCTLLGGDAWGWTPKSATDIMSLDSCVKLIVKVVTQDGNLLLNVGPRPDGTIEPAEVQRLKDLGQFLAKYGESIYNTRGGVYDDSWGGTTLGHDAIYVHVLRVPPGGKLSLPTVGRRVVDARYLFNGRAAAFSQSREQINVTDIAGIPGESDVVIKLSLK